MLAFPVATVLAKSVPVGDIILLGTVERSGLRLTNDTTLFEGDSLRTHGKSGASCGLDEVGLK
jgi:hypothetical protein